MWCGCKYDYFLSTRLEVVCQLTLYLLQPIMLQSMQRALQRYVAEVRHATTPRGYSFSHNLVLFDFTKEEVLTEWDCISDKDVGGRSHANLEINGKGLVVQNSYI